MSVHVWQEPMQRFKAIIMHDHWTADNGHDAVLFCSRAEAVHFVETHWFVDEHDIKFVSPPR